MISVGKTTIVLELAFSKKLPIPTHFSPVLYLVLFDKIIPFLLCAKMLFWFFYSRFFIDLVGRRRRFWRSKYFRLFTHLLLLIIVAYLCRCIWIVVKWFSMYLFFIWTIIYLKIIITSHCSISRKHSDLVISLISRHLIFLLSKIWLYR